MAAACAQPVVQSPSPGRLFLRWIVDVSVCFVCALPFFLLSAVGGTGPSHGFPAVLALHPGRPGRRHPGGSVPRPPRASCRGRYARPDDPRINQGGRLVPDHGRHRGRDRGAGWRRDALSRPATRKIRRLRSLAGRRDFLHRHVRVLAHSSAENAMELLAGGLLLAWLYRHTGRSGRRLPCTF